MFNLKVFMRCCCENPAAEEDKQVKSSKNSKREIIQAKPHMAINLQNAEPKLIEESVVIAAPLPNQEKNSIEYPRLRLKIIESSTISVGTILKINATGLEGSKRNKNDYKTFIGSQLVDNGEIINDYVIDEESQGMGKQHLLIKFNPSSSKYLISDLGDGTGTFIKVGSELVLKDGFIISFGTSHMKIMSTGSMNSLDKKIVVKFLEGPKINEDFCFQPSDDTILIGRMADCRIRFDDSNLSRYQCNISYHQERGWILKDGNGEKKSTNGTWLYVENEFEIYELLVFKAGKTLFESYLE
ncbi:hypothetical protein SteCoe_35735 [Stentor coeruleus]|uniref:FHA domain-containing protein n=1 Tax=Stentor coeruleus TaxID=5963 RepID=A0A1R2ARX7_9CILI|nr:hypothetical protein SteCoe_35735 [Stentor coeruleus]